MRFKKSIFLASSLLLGAVTTHAMAATFKVPTSYQIMYIDLKDGNNYGDDFEVTIPSGHHQIVVRYNQSLRHGGDVDMIKSEPLIIDMDVKKGANLELKAPFIHQKDRAEKYSQKPTFDIVNSKGDEVQYKVSMLPLQPGFQPLRNYREEIKEFTGEGATKPQANTSANASYSAPAPAPKSVTQTNEFQMMQFWFNKSDEQTRKNFRIWIVDHTYQTKVKNTQYEMLQFWYNKANKAERKAFQVWLLQ
ncbi:DUF2057 domain-containing protein [Marinomonas spartinae]|uniref:YccT family protein n=1 Tax=Marinomonas spartinae TaxID=1792290 RepID=UPI0018F12EA6|nr:DUF2057 domain-containing protein [Marinomonas spartinae]MBJ7552927.1 DUF2057 domain-containing protein [Marinomonas spartinae]